MFRPLLWVWQCRCYSHSCYSHTSHSKPADFTYIVHFRCSCIWPKSSQSGPVPESLRPEPKHKYPARWGDMVLNSFFSHTCRWKRNKTELGTLFLSRVVRWLLWWHLINTFYRQWLCKLCVICVFLYILVLLSSVFDFWFFFTNLRVF